MRDRLQQQCKGEDGMQLLSLVEKLVALDNATMKRPSDVFSKFAMANRRGTLPENKRQVALQGSYYTLQMTTGPLMRNFVPTGMLNETELHRRYGLKIHHRQSSNAQSTADSLFSALSHQFFFQDDAASSQWLRRALVYIILLNYNDDEEPRTFQEETGMTMLEWEAYMSRDDAHGNLFVLQRFARQFGLIIDVFVGGKSTASENKPIRFLYANAKNLTRDTYYKHFNLGWNADNRFVSLVPVEWVQDRPAEMKEGGEVVEDISPFPIAKKPRRQQQAVTFSGQDTIYTIPSRRCLTYIIFDTCSLIMHARLQRRWRGSSDNNRLVFPFDRNNPDVIKVDICFIPLAVKKELEKLKVRVNPASPAGYRCISNNLAVSPSDARDAIQAISHAKDVYTETTVQEQEEQEYDGHCHIQQSHRYRRGDSITAWNDELIRRAVRARLLDGARVILVSDDLINTMIASGNGSNDEMLLTLTYLQYVELSHMANIDFRMQPMDQLRNRANGIEKQYRF